MPLPIEKKTIYILRYAHDQLWSLVKVRLSQYVTVRIPLQPEFFGFSGGECGCTSFFFRSLTSVTGFYIISNVLTHTRPKIFRLNWCVCFLMPKWLLWSWKSCMTFSLSVFGRAVWKINVSLVDFFLLLGWYLRIKIPSKRS